MNYKSNYNKPICISCLYPIDPDSHFCFKCRAPLDSFALTAPLLAIHSAGRGFQSLAKTKPKLIVLIGLWLVFTPVIFTGFLFTFKFLFQRAGFLQFIIIAPFSIVGVCIVYKTSKRFFCKKTN